MSEHHHDRGLGAFIRYLGHAPRMWRSPVNRTVVDLVDPQPGEICADVGAGLGPATVLAARRGADVWAIDPSHYMRGALRLRRLGQRARPRIQVVDGSAEHLPLPDGSVDALWSVNAMHHWVDLEAALAEVSRVVRDGGRLALVDEDFDDPRHPLHQRMRLRRRHENHGCHEFDMVDAEEVGRHLGSVGFENITAGDRDLVSIPCIAIEARRKPRTT